MNIKENLPALKVPLEMSRGSSRTAKAFVVSSSKRLWSRVLGLGQSRGGSVSQQGGPSGIVGLPLSTIWGHPQTRVIHQQLHPCCVPPAHRPSSPRLPPSLLSCWFSFHAPNSCPENRNLTGHSRANLSLQGHHPALKLRPPPPAAASREASVGAMSTNPESLTNT